jgi:hypothetical protein
MTLSMHSKASSVHSKTSVRLDFLASFYNDLPEVEIADAAIKSKRKVEIAHEVLVPIFWRHGVLGFCGINLLHKHWTVNDGEIPEQSRKKHNSDYHLITTPVSKSTSSAQPWSWALRVVRDNAHFVPFEFSVDEETKRYSTLLSGKPEFFAEVGSVLLNHELHTHFGICIAVREPLSNNPLARAVEVSSPNERISIIRPTVSQLTESESYIGTSWTFRALAASTPKKPGSDDPTPPPDVTCVVYNECVSDNPAVGPPYHSPTNHRPVDPE